MSTAPSGHFYAGVFDSADRRELLGAAAGVEGLESEIAVLRLLLRKELSKHDGTDFKLLQSGIRLLIQALLAQHRLTPQQAENLGDSMVAFLEQFGGALLASDGASE